MILIWIVANFLVTQSLSISHNAFIIDYFIYKQVPSVVSFTTSRKGLYTLTNFNRYLLQSDNCNAFAGFWTYTIILCKTSVPYCSI